VAQMLFYQSDEQCEMTYKQRGGKYMGQTGVTPPRA
ncbi:MAG: dCTP deaminase, partial [OM182 bacterium]